MKGKLEKLEDRIAHGLTQATRAGKLHWRMVNLGTVNQGWETYIDHILGRVTFKNSRISIQRDCRVVHTAISHRTTEELRGAINTYREKLEHAECRQILEHAADTLEAIVRGDKPPGLYGDPQGKKT